MPSPLTSIFPDHPTSTLFGSTEVVVHHGPTSRLPAPLTTGILSGLDTLCEGYRGEIDVASGTVNGGHQQPISGVSPAAALAMGLSVYFKEMALQSGDLGALAWAVADELGVPRDCVRLGVFSNAPGSGLPVHHDACDQILVQLQGRKRFRFRPPLVPSPTESFAPTHRPERHFAEVYGGGFPTTAHCAEANLDEVELTPGSAVFFPGGTLHSTAGQPEQALSMSITVWAPSQADVFLNFLRHALARDPAWRSVPWGGWRGDDDAAATLRTLTDQLAARLPALDLTDAFASWSLGRFRELGGELYPGEHHWNTFIRMPDAHVELRDLDDGLLAIVRTGHLRVPRTRREVHTGGPARAVLEHILTLTQAFTVAELLARFPDLEADDMRGLLEHLGRAELIRPVAAPPI